MPAPAAIRATFHTWRPVNGRKCLQLVFEIPMEQQSEVLKFLGAPMPDNPEWFGIAKLNPVSASDEQTERSRSSGSGAGRELTPADRAIKMAHTHAGGSEEVLQGIRDYCGVKSCSEFKTNPGALKRFHDWEIYNGFVPEPRR